MAILGCIADDFTGASDIASFLVKGGMRVQLLNGVPEDDQSAEADGIVISLKTRTQETKAAVRDSLAALQWLKRQGCVHFYVKYCSTFDSTPEGNIGPICDAAMNWLDVDETILCPALPINGRVVREGRLYVKGVPLDQSPMRNHPVTPMWDSDIRRLMSPQSRYAVYREAEAPLQMTQKHYVVPDCETDADLTAIAKRYGQLPLLTGGSGLAEPLARLWMPEENRASCMRGTVGPALILIGSCSEQTRRQIQAYQAQGAPCYYLDPICLLQGEVTLDEVKRWLHMNRRRAPMVYTSGSPEQVAAAHRFGRERVSATLEQSMAELAETCVRDGVTRVIVAGGETSGAVSQRLRFHQYEIGESVAPGVPIMMPTEKPELRLVLKSGNFGDDDFFAKAVAMTGRRNDDA